GRAPRAHPRGAPRVHPRGAAGAAAAALAARGAAALAAGVPGVAIGVVGSPRAPVSPGLGARTTGDGHRQGQQHRGRRPDLLLTPRGRLTCGSHARSLRGPMPAPKVKENGSSWQKGVLTSPTSPD